MQLTIDDLRKHGVEIEDSWIARMGPAHFRHINFRGLFNFGVDEYRESLLAVRRSGVGRTVR
jgi:hypothetical protein